MLNLTKKVLKWIQASKPTSGYHFSRPLVLLQSDDWGRVGVRDEEGYQQLLASGMKLGEKPYDFYTLETANDVTALRELLARHRDCTGRPACMVMNFLSANLDFPKMAADGFKKVQLLSLKNGLPGNWKRPGLFTAYRDGVAGGVFFPALHGLTHFCPAAVEAAIAKSEERFEGLRCLWQAETPYIYWRMPWVGYEYSNPEPPDEGFLTATAQDDLIRQAVRFFEDFFSNLPVSACAPGYRANEDTRRAWSKYGVRIVQNGTGVRARPSMDDNGMLSLSRTLDFEPSQSAFQFEDALRLVGENFTRGMPSIISVHSINFHSSLRDFRSATLIQLDQFLSALEAKYPELLYVHDGDIYDLVNLGKFTSSQGTVCIEVKQEMKI